MKTYFTPLRRRMGALSLVIACLLTAIWMRSCRNVDLVFIRVSPFEIVAFSGGQACYFARWDLYRETNVVIEEGSSSAVRLVVSRKEGFVQGKRATRWYSWPTSQAIAFEEDGERYERATMIPFLWIVLPLTLFSAYLLLSNPRLALLECDSATTAA